MKKKIINISKIFLASVLAAAIILGLSTAIDMAAAAWQEPTGAAPTNNVAPPINNSNTPQEKQGRLMLDPNNREGQLPTNINNALSVYSDTTDDPNGSTIYSQRDGSGYAGYFSGKMGIAEPVIPKTEITWATHDVSDPEKNWQSVAFGHDEYGNGVFVAVNDTGTSKWGDGAIWFSGNLDITRNWSSVTYGNGKFVAVARSATTAGFRVATSPNGLNWTFRATPSDNAWASVTYGNGLFVAVASTGVDSFRVMTSPDGITWTKRTSAANYQWESVAYGNGLFVAVARTGVDDIRVITSPDGITWTLRASAAPNNWRSVAYGEGLFVAVASGGTTDKRVMTSPDGINWTPTNAAANYFWTSITYGNSTFMAVASTGTGKRAMLSLDGTTWTLVDTPADNSWKSVTYGNGIFVAVAYTGNNNRAMTSNMLESETDGLSVKTNSTQSTIYAEQSGSGYAGYFSGDVKVDGKIDIGLEMVSDYSDGLTGCTINMMCPNDTKLAGTGSCIADPSGTDKLDVNEPIGSDGDYVGWKCSSKCTDIGRRWVKGYVICGRIR